MGWDKDKEIPYQSPSQESRLDLGKTNSIYWHVKWSWIVRNRDEYEENNFPHPSPFSQAHLGSVCYFSVEKPTCEANTMLKAASRLMISKDWWSLFHLPYKFSKTSHGKELLIRRQKRNSDAERAGNHGFVSQALFLPQTDIPVCLQRAYLHGTAAGMPRLYVYLAFWNVPIPPLVLQLNAALQHAMLTSS